jgi:hypothetical protein
VICGTQRRFWDSPVSDHVKQAGENEQNQEVMVGAAGFEPTTT